jgi:ABC-2 type transport system permease protein
VRNAGAIARREIRSYFTSPIAYVVLVIFSVLGGWFFYNLFAYYSLMSMQAMQDPYYARNLNLTQGVASPLFHNLTVIFIFLLPLVTMRLLAEEKRSGTIELLLTYPVRDVEAVLGKFLGAMAVYGAMLGLSTLYPGLMAIFGDVEAGPIASGYLGLALFGAACIALGTWVSSLTENQIVAAVGGFGALLLFFVVGWAGSVAGPTLGKLVTHLSLVDHMDDFAKGVIDTADVIFFLNFTVFFLFLTLRSLETRRWRG